VDKRSFDPPDTRLQETFLWLVPVVFVVLLLANAWHASCQAKLKFRGAAPGECELSDTIAGWIDSPVFTVIVVAVLGFQVVRLLMRSHHLRRNGGSAWDWSDLASEKQYMGYLFLALGTTWTLPRIDDGRLFADMLTSPFGWIAYFFILFWVIPKLSRLLFGPRR
jgi:hypothetical protein